jgi:hypothetical protein
MVKFIFKWSNLNLNRLIICRHLINALWPQRRAVAPGVALTGALPPGPGGLLGYRPLSPPRPTGRAVAPAVETSLRQESAASTIQAAFASDQYLPPLERNLQERNSRIIGGLNHH